MPHAADARSSDTTFRYAASPVFQIAPRVASLGHAALSNSQRGVHRAATASLFFSRNYLMLTGRLVAEAALLASAPSRYDYISDAYASVRRSVTPAAPPLMPRHRSQDRAPRRISGAVIWRDLCAFSPAAHAATSAFSSFLAGRHCARGEPPVSLMMTLPR